jgi:hypothetical protein
MSGAVSVLFMILAKTTGYEISFSIAGWLCVALAGFLLWLKENRKVIDLSEQVKALKNSPERKAIRLQIEHYIQMLENFQRELVPQGPVRDEIGPSRAVSKSRREAFETLAADLWEEALVAKGSVATAHQLLGGSQGLVGRSFLGRRLLLFCEFCELCESA